jgi:ribosomal protein S18 acetylase RimI-like enzyme
MSEAFLVRAATLGDYDQVCALLAPVDELHRVNVPWLFCKPSTEPRSKDFFAGLLSDEDSTVLVAEARDGLVGVATAVMRSAPNFAVFVSQRWGVLDNLAVLDAWRRRGVGTSLTRQAERWVNGRGAKWIELGVYEFNAAARSFYQALGYLPVTTKLRKPLDDAG